MNLNVSELNIYFALGKRRKLKLAEEMEQEEQTTSSNRTSNPPIVSQNHRDVEAGNRP